MRTLIIGYGSLLQKESLNRTLPQVKEIEPIYFDHSTNKCNFHLTTQPLLLKL